MSQATAMAKVSGSPCGLMFPTLNTQICLAPRLQASELLLSHLYSSSAAPRRTRDGSRPVVVSA